jgi:hypothetical protein
MQFRRASDFLDAQVKPSSALIVAAMRTGHERLIRMLNEAALAVSSAHADAPQRFADFGAATRRHMAGEEQHLFPLLEAQGQDLHVLQRDHRQLADAIDRALRELDRGDIARLSDVTQELMLGLSAHRIREERLFVASADAILGGAPPQLVERLGAIFSE